MTEILSNFSPVKNVKVLKKSLINLSMTVVYPPNGFRFHILSNVTPKILAIFGDFIRRYEDKSQVSQSNPASEAKKASAFAITIALFSG